MPSVGYMVHSSHFFFLPNSQKAFAFVEYGTRSCLSGSDRGVARASTVKISDLFFFFFLKISTLNEKFGVLSS